MKLSKENIKFIDNYLINSEVAYYDVRIEMLDHVAAAVEQKMDAENVEFYDAFKEYMRLNKKELLKRAKFWSVYSKETVLSFFKFLVHPLQLLFGLGFFWVLGQSSIFSLFSEHFSFRRFFYCCFIGLAVIQFLYFHVILKKRFYSLERIGGVLALIYYLLIFLMPLGSTENPSVVFVTFFSYLIVAYVVFFIREVSKFRKKNKILFQ
ncbi:hypothetical protein ACFS5J_09585 [Flavobacterium chuncheonense]|uniref:Uncharacterized protein n=1 Tax=Flavobacterium chuncheonense TaxID=2026653 RepID=A0ABW5YMZ2_9FLAO